MWTSFVIFFPTILVFHFINFVDKMDRPLDDSVIAGSMFYDVSSSCHLS